MKPSFALDFRDGAIALLHRTTRGWQEVGSTPLDAADLTESLNYLRTTALGLSPRGLTTKVVIPNDLVLYTKVYAPGPDVAKRKKQIKAALEGLTPYKVEDLVYDWWGNGQEVQVAVVAKGTLVEAEAFAVEHRLNPVSFVAAPENAAYMGEPFFGVTALSATLLADGEKVERDQDPISVVAREFSRPDADLQPASQAAVAPQTATTVAPAVAVEAIVEPAATIPVASRPVDPKPEAESRPVVATEPEPIPAAALVVEPSPVEPNPLPDFRAVVPPPAGVAAFDPQAMAIELVDEAPMAVDVGSDPVEPPFMAKPAPQPESKAPVVAADDVPPGPAASIAAAFASRRATAVVNDPDPAEFAAAAAAKAKKSMALGPAPQQRPSVPRPALARPPAAVPAASRDTVPFPTKTQPPKFGASKLGKVAVTAPGIAGLGRERIVVPLPKAKPTAADEGTVTPAARSGSKVATGLDGRPLPTRGKPRFLGLFLTAILLLALALVAAWSSFYLSSNETDPNAVPTTEGTAALPPQPETVVSATGSAPTAADPTAQVLTEASATDVLPTAQDEALADGQDAAPDAATTVASTAVAATENPAIGATAADPAATETVVEAVKPEPAPGTALSTDTALVGAPANEPQDEIFLAAADTPPQTSDPLSLPQMAANSDPPPTEAAPPPPFGTVYQFDADGRIKPTPEGIVTPEGVLLIAGPPKVVPPQKPAALSVSVPAPAAEAGLAPTAGAISAATSETPVVPEPIASDPALAGKKPRPRPAGLVDPATATAKQGEVLAPDPNSRFAALRPKTRPQALTQTASVAADTLSGDASAASLAVNGIQPSALAVAVSKKPAARPSGMDQAVDAAVAAALQTPEPEQQVAAAAPEAQSEPEVEAPAPNLPTSASVAKQATTKDALNLSRVSLLGIFGTASGRYAMVRQPGGGVKKVVVGDSIDGGRIAAITATAVEYQKGGRMVTLSLPSG